MNFLLKYLLKRAGQKLVVPEKPGRHVVQDKYPVIEAFTVDGIKYFRFEDPFNIPAGRMFAVMTAYEEIRMKCDKEYLESHTKAMERIFSQKTLNLQHIIQLNLNLKERLDLVPPTSFVYRLASVIFFDETELLHIHDYTYADVKIARWKEADGVLGFFLIQHIKELMPSLNIPVDNSRAYMEVAEKIDKIHRRVVTELSSEQESKTAKSK